MIVFTPTSRGNVCIMDFSDWVIWGKFNWWSTANNYTAGRTDKRKIEYLHRKIMKPIAGIDVDHINGDKHDNRRRNLGYHENEDDAARAYNKAAVSLFGEFALLNEVED